jgi:hypothetical protein
VLDLAPGLLGEPQQRVRDAGSLRWRNIGAPRSS